MAGWTKPAAITTARPVTTIAIMVAAPRTRRLPNMGKQPSQRLHPLHPCGRRDATRHLPAARKRAQRVLRRYIEVSRDMGPHLDRDNDGIACEPYRGR